MSAKFMRVNEDDFGTIPTDEWVEGVFSTNDRDDSRNVIVKVIEAERTKHAALVKAAEADRDMWWLLVCDAMLAEPEWFEFLLSAYGEWSGPMTDEARALGDAALAAREQVNHG